MDAGTIQAAIAGLRFAIDSLRTIAGTKAQIAADAVAFAFIFAGVVKATL